MKKENVKVYSDPIHEETIKKELAAAQDALKSVLDVWNGLDLVPCKEIHALIMNPQKVYATAVEELAVVPVSVGRFQISKQAYINTLDIPIPDSLYRVCKQARTHPFAGLKELWQVVDDKVQLVESEAGNLIDSQSIYASSEAQAAFCQKVNNFVEAVNELSPLLKGSLLDSPSLLQQLGLDFKIIYQENRPQLAVNPDLLHRWIQGIF
jgi:hypothetical protein